MRSRKLLLLLAGGAAAATLALGGGVATAGDPIVLQFDGAFTAKQCAPAQSFDVPTGEQTIDVVATATVPSNDIVLTLYGPGGEQLARSDTATSPEAVHYDTGSELTAGQYSFQVCPFQDPSVPPQDPMTYEAVVTITPLPVPSITPSGTQGGTIGSLSFTGGVDFAPATVVSANFLGAEPQTTIERKVSGTMAGRVGTKRIYVDWPGFTSTQTSIFSRSEDGGDTFRLLIDHTCDVRSRPNCDTGGGGDSEEDVNLVTGDLFIADQEGVVVNEGLASSTDHGDTFAPTRQFDTETNSTGTDRQWLAWVDPRNVDIGGRGIEAFLTYHVPVVGQFVIGIDEDGVPIEQPVPQITDVGQSGQPRVDNSPTSPGRGWIYQPYRSFVNGGGFTVGTAFGPEYQNPEAWHATVVSSDSPEIFPWIALDDGGNAYGVWTAGGKTFLSISPILDKRNDPRQGGRPGSYWTPQIQVNPSSLGSTVFPEVTAGAKGRVAIAYMGSNDCSGVSDDCPKDARWGTYVTVISDALGLARGEKVDANVGQVNHRVDHRGAICTGGTGCDSGRDLLDMLDLSYDQSGRIGVVFMDNNNALAAPNGTDVDKEYPFTLFAKETQGPSLKGADVDVKIPTGGRTDRAGDATWPNKAGAANLPAFDLRNLSVKVGDGKLVATFGLGSATKAAMARDLAAYNDAVATDSTAAAIQYVVWFATDNQVFHLDAKYDGTNLTFFGGRLDGNDAQKSATGGITGARYSPDDDFPVTGTAGSKSITLTVPLSALREEQDSNLTSVTAFSLAAPADDDLWIHADRTVDATPPFQVVR